MTPAEFNDLKEGYFKQRRRDLEIQAGWVATIINFMPMRGKNAKSIRIEQLIGYSPEQVTALEREHKRKRKLAKEQAEEQ